MNLHIHTRFSDGDYLPETILEYLSQSSPDIKILGFSDHCLALKPSLFKPVQIQHYCDRIQQLRQAFPHFTLLAGAELDIQSFDLRLTDLLQTFDFINIEYMREMSDFKKLEKIRRAFPRPIFLVHTLFSEQDQKMAELFRIKKKNYPDLLKAMRDNDLGLELTDGNRNCLPDLNQEMQPYFHYYPDLLQQIAEFLLPISIGSDMHHNLEELNLIGRAAAAIEACNLQNNYQRTLHLLNYHA
ncbi:MAG: hypothetical protein KBA26_03215 [Candidatus Delongbacteria bacterium]|nr:hypothetical protein [Candidatus Delongbacteria bacterium]